MLLGSVIQYDPNGHQHRPDGREAGDLVPKDNNAEPDGQGVLHRAGHAGGRTGKQKETEKIGSDLILRSCLCIRGRNRWGFCLDPGPVR